MRGRTSEVISFDVGPARVTRIGEVLEPGFDPALFDTHPILARADYFDRASGRLMSSVQSWLIRLGGRTILVDTCSGNGKIRQLPLFQRFHMLDLPYLDTLARAGVTPDEVNLVVCTHLHVDHVGWNTRWDGERWAPTFRNARYVFGRAELAHWTTGAGPRHLPANVAAITDSVLPVLEAKMVDLVAPGDEIAPGLVVEAAPGHTAHQFNLRYTAPGDAGSFLCSADVLNQPIQVYAPELNSGFCEDAEQARQTRLRVLRSCAAAGTLLLPCHFGFPHAGYVREAGAGFRFEPAIPIAPATTIA